MRCVQMLRMHRRANRCPAVSQAIFVAARHLLAVAARGAPVAVLYAQLTSCPLFGLCCIAPDQLQAKRVMSQLAMWLVSLRCADGTRSSQNINGMFVLQDLRKPSNAMYAVCVLHCTCKPIITDQALRFAGVAAETAAQGRVVWAGHAQGPRSNLKLWLWATFPFARPGLSNFTLIRAHAPTQRQVLLHSRRCSFRPIS